MRLALAVYAMSLVTVVQVGCRPREQQVAKPQKFKPDVVMLTSMVPPSMLQPSASTKAVSGDELKQRIDSWQSFYAVSPDTANNSCANKIAKAVVHATANIAMVSATIDLSDCARAELNIAGMATELLSYTVKVGQSFKCVGGDFSTLNGKQGKDLLRRTMALCKSKQLEYIQSDITESKLRFKVEGMDTNLTTTAFGETAAPGQRPCILQKDAKGDFGYLGGCRTTIATRSLTASAVAEGRVYEQSDFSQIDLKGLTLPLRAARGSFFATGTVNFTFNNWVGNMTYAGVKAPTWQAKNSKDTHESATGTLGSTALR